MTSKSYLPEYAIWGQIIQRCTNKNSQSFQMYGGRGITICERWRKSFDNFYADMGPRPAGGFTIDRIDNESGYSPENCRWADRQTQTNNRRNMRILEHNGQRMSIGQWARHLGTQYITIQRRLAKGLPMELVLSATRLPRGL